MGNALGVLEADLAAARSRAAELEAELARVKSEQEAKEAARSAAARNLDTQAGVVDAARMRRVLAQDAVLDVGTDHVLRNWLVKDPKGFLAAVAEREREERGDAERDELVKRQTAEIAELKSHLAGSGSGPDLGTAKVEKLLREFRLEFDADEAGRCKACGR